MTKKVYLLFIFAILVTSGTLAYTINYLMNTTVQHNVEIGNTIKTVDGLTVTLLNAEQGNLTYYEIDETTTDKHTLTYTYEYEILNRVYNIVVSSLNNNIEIVTYNIGEYITIEFALNQDIEFTQGEVIEIEFLFELVEELYFGLFSVNNPFNPNTATEEDMIALGMNSVAIERTITKRELSPFDNLLQWAIATGTAGFEQEYQPYVDMGIIVFE